MDSRPERHPRRRHLRDHASSPATAGPSVLAAPRRRGVAAALALLMVASACSDTSTSPSDKPVSPTLPGGANRVAQVLECRVDVGAANLTCASAVPSANLTPATQLGRGARATVMVGNQNRYVRMASTNVTVASGIFSADVTVQNLLLEPMGTVDGTTLDPAGVRVFFSTGPTNGVEVANADGTGTFTAANQPYFQYSQVLQQAQVSSVKPWAFILNGATSFTFEVYVAAEVPDDPGITLSLGFISAGYQHVCGLDANTSHAYCWGDNTYGQLGDGTTTNRTTPTPVAGGLTFAILASGYDHTCGFTPDRKAYCWGNNSHGQLGDGTTINRSIPTQVTGDLTFNSLSAAAHTCGITGQNVAYCWGENTDGQLGDGTNVDRSAPTAVAGGLTFLAIGAGGDATSSSTTGHTCAIAVDAQGSPGVPGFPGIPGVQGGPAYCWGDNTYGQLGDGTTTSQNTPVAVSGGLTFAPYGAGLTVGAHHSCAVTLSTAPGVGSVPYCWGDNTYGQLGDGTTTGRSTPTVVGGGLLFTYLQTGPGSLHTCGIAPPTVVVYCWGRNANGQLGDGTSTDRSTPTPVGSGGDYFPGAVGGDFTCGIHPVGFGLVYCWGNNDKGQIGDGTTVQRLAPTPVASTKPRTFILPPPP